MVIKEFLPNPPGKDTEGEYILIANEADIAIDLASWQLRDAGGKQYTFASVTILPGEELLLPYSQTRITLNNKGETIYLIDPAGVTVSEVSYTGSAKEGVAITSLVGAESKAGLYEAYAVDFSGTVPGVTGASPVLFIIIVASIFAALTVWIMRDGIVTE